MTRPQDIDPQSDDRPSPLPPALSRRISSMGFLCACLVVSAHALCTAEAGELPWWLYQLLGQGVSTIAVPYFFVVSGFFLARHAYAPGWWAAENGKRLRTLFVPYLLWTTLFTIADLALRTIANLAAGKPPAASFPSLWTIVSKTLGLIPGENPLLGPMWYVRALLLLCLASGLIVPLIRKGKALAKGWLLFSALLYLGYLALGGRTTWPFFNHFFSLRGLFYFSVGLYLALWPVTPRIPQRGAIFLLLLSLAVFTGFTWNQWRPLPFTPPHPDLVIPLAIAALFTLLPGRPLPDFLARTTFPVYCIHMFAILALYRTIDLLRLSELATGTATGFLLITTLAIALSILATQVLRRMAPRIAAVLFGGR